MRMKTAFKPPSSSVCYFISLSFFFLIESINGIDVTFTPQRIYLTTADLPRPYATASASKPARVVPLPDNATFYVPEGFSVKMYTTDVVSPRYLIYTPSDDILVSEPNINRISCLVDSDGDGYLDQRLTFADQANGLNSPFGMAFADGYFYVGNKDNTRRYSWKSGSRNISGTGEIVMNYASSGHWTRTVVVSPTGDRLFVSVGSASNVDAEPLPRASIQQANLDGTNQTTYAYGLRNPVGLAFHPITNDLYVACQERDALGDDLVPDFFTRVQQNEFYGWPYAYLSPNLTDPRRVLSNGTSERSDLVSVTKTPDVLFQAHSAVMDMRFYTGTQFPSHYQNGAFAAFRGSWNRNSGTGYKIVFIPFNTTSHRPLGYYEDFVYGFLTNPSGPDTFGRPVGLLVLKDGSLLFTEDGNNRMYQVQYNSSARSDGLNDSVVTDSTATTDALTTFPETTSIDTGVIISFPDNVTSNNSTSETFTTSSLNSNSSETMEPTFIVISNSSFSSTSTVAPVNVTLNSSTIDTTVLIGNVTINNGTGLDVTATISSTMMTTNSTPVNSTATIPTIISNATMTNPMDNNITAAISSSTMALNATATVVTIIDNATMTNGTSSGITDLISSTTAVTNPTSTNSSATTSNVISNATAVNSTTGSTNTDSTIYINASSTSTERISTTMNTTVIVISTNSVSTATIMTTTTTAQAHSNKFSFSLLLSLALFYFLLS